MDVFQLTRAMVDINSVTPNEVEMGRFFYDYLKPLADKYDGEIDSIEVEKDRNNVFVRWGHPDVVLSTHMDTVPPFIPSKEDDEFIWGRAACDTKGISASMIKAIEALLEEGVRNLGFADGRRRRDRRHRCAFCQPHSAGLEVPHQRRAD